MNKNISEFLDFMNASPSGYHAVANLAAMLESAGYQQLREKNAWNLVPGGKYYVSRGGTSLMAFRIPETVTGGFLMSASHSDRPTFKIKENAELVGAYTRLAVERYGGMLMAPWLDRPLGVAGRVLVETETGIQNKLLHIDRDLLMMPNVAIHMNRQANDGYKWNPAVDTIPLLGSKEAKGKWNALLEQEAGGKILGHDLYLYVRDKAKVWGIEEEFVSAPALDDLECAWGCTKGFLNAQDNGCINMLCVFDSEEVGSASVQGAGSTLLSDILSRICKALNLDLTQMLANSFLVSADNAHGIHPNHPEFADPNNAPVLGGGVVVKYNATLRYCTDGLSTAIFRKVCEKADAPVQTYCNRADMPGGSTLGCISLAHVSVPTVDIGLAQLAMHSSYETAAVADLAHLEKAMAAFYSSNLDITPEGFTL